MMTPSDKVALAAQKLEDLEFKVVQLRECELFRLYSLRDLEVVAGMVEIRTIRAGERIFVEGDTADWLAFVIEGKFSITKQGTHQQPITVSREYRSRLLGEMAVIDGEPRSATCTSASGARLAILRASDFDRLGEDYPRIGFRLLRDVAKILSTRLRATTGRLVDSLD
jgi:CRP-like cAMP-binding protein